MREEVIKINNLVEYPAAAKKFIAAMGDNRIFAFYSLTTDFSISSNCCSTYATTCYLTVAVYCCNVFV